MHQPELQLPQDPPEIIVQPEPEPKEVVVTSRATSIFEEDPEKWIRNNIISKNMSLKAQFLGRMGLGAQATSSLSRESIQRCSTYHARETKQQDQEEASIASTNDAEEELVIDRCYSNLVGDFAINFFKKSDEEVRNRYINRLVGMRILKLEPKKKHQSMLIFDWDDTLLCTHYLARLGFVNLSTEALENLLPVDESACQLLLKAVECGPTLIITNSAEGWVQYSGKLYFPKTYQVIMDKNIKVISARTGYEDAFPGDSHRWKVEAFLNIECLFEKNVVTNLLCLGDSHIEMDAAHILAKKFDQALIKTIKFKEKPKPDELIKQQELVRERLEMIFTSQKNHTIRLEKKVYKQGEL